LGGIFSPNSGMRGCILIKHHSYSLPGPRDTGDIFKIMRSKVKATDNIFEKCTFLADAYYQCFPVEDCLVVKEDSIKYTVYFF